jgi:hypothetical protein
MWDVYGFQANFASAQEHVLAAELTCDIPNAFIQTDVQTRDDDGNRTIMKIRGNLVDIRIPSTVNMSCRKDIKVCYTFMSKKHFTDYLCPLRYFTED